MKIAKSFCRFVIKSIVYSSDIVIAEKLKLGGVFVCGGMSQLEGICEYLAQNTGLNVKISSYGANAVIYGARLMLDEKVFDR
jgi:activator of 2-hydroxyglutaryl-CoA dehydratase